jgi:hypothetical protein
LSNGRCLVIWPTSVLSLTSFLQWKQSKRRENVFAVDETDTALLFSPVKKV